jgi:NADH pyrophosphatase NudC (nudix superfamily)
VAVEREVMEEVNLRLERVRFLCSQPNRYAYLGVEYPVLDLYFTARATDPERAQALDEVEDVQWLDPRAVDPEELAFPSMGAALRVLMERV